MYSSYYSSPLFVIKYILSNQFTINMAATIQNIVIPTPSPWTKSIIFILNKSPLLSYYNIQKYDIYDLIVAVCNNFIYIHYHKNFLTSYNTTTPTIRHRSHKKSCLFNTSNVINVIFWIVCNYLHWWFI